MKNFILFGSVLLLMFGTFCFDTLAQKNSENTAVQSEATSNKELEVSNSELVVARVLSVEQVNQRFDQRLEDSEGFRVIAIEKISLKVLEGTQQGVVYNVENNLTTNSNNISVSQGDKVLVSVHQLSDGTFEILIEDTYHISKIYFFGCLFLLVLVLLFKTTLLKILLLFTVSGAGFYWLFYLTLENRQEYLFFVPIISLLVVSSMIMFGMNKKALLNMISSACGASAGFIVYTLLKPFLITSDLVSVFGVSEFNLSGLILVTIISIVVWGALLSAKLTMFSLEKFPAKKKYQNVHTLLYYLWKHTKIRMLYVYFLVLLMCESLLLIFVDFMQEDVATLSFTTILNQEIFLFILLIAFTIFAVIFITSYIICTIVAYERFGFKINMKQEKLF